ncbi:MAG: nitrate/nitrite transporter NrtS [Gammaproteobacteria bacterium]
MWATWREALVVCAYRPHLRKTVRIAAIVGTILFTINQLDVVLSGRATVGVWLKVGLTYLVPFCVSNWGILVATRRPRP